LSAFVVDTSFAASWFLPDEANSGTTGDGVAIARFAFKHNLTSHDATYLALALKKKGSLAAAAKAAGVTVLVPLGSS
jgi:predicted nucleic acid-binding protein